VTDGEPNMRLIMAAAFAATAFAGSGALAQSTYRHHNFCLQTSTSSKECAYDSMAQCEASKRENTDTCVPNGPPVNH